MGDLGQMLFDQANAMNEQAVMYLRIGRAQFAREVEAWIRRNADAHGNAHTESLLALCRKELA